MPGVTFGSLIASDLGVGVVAPLPGRHAVWVAGNCSGRFRCGRSSRAVLCEQVSGTAAHLVSGRAWPPINDQNENHTVASSTMMVLPAKPAAICDCEHTTFTMSRRRGLPRMSAWAALGPKQGTIGTHKADEAVAAVAVASKAAQRAVEAAAVAATAVVAARTAATVAEAAEAAKRTVDAREQAAATGGTLGGPSMVASLQDGRDRPIKVFVLAGQSNMEGHGVVAQHADDGGESRGTLRYMAQHPRTAAALRPALDGFGRWVIRDDVWLFNSHHMPYSNGSQGLVQGRKTTSWGALTVGYGKRCTYNKRAGGRRRAECRKAPTFCCPLSETFIGPEFSFGLRMGDFFEEQVLLIKVTVGSAALAREFRPPSSSQASGSTAGAGPHYMELVRTVRDVLRPRNLSKLFRFPAKQLAAGHELVGLAWFQGYQDSLNRASAIEYESNMVNLIRDLRRDWESPRLAVCIAVAGIGGFEDKTSWRELVISAQFDAADPRRHPELGPNMRAEETRAYWRPQESSPPPWQAHHWGRNAESMWNIGSAMADGLLEALTGKSRHRLVAGRSVSVIDRVGLA